jgi:hypothetical protein
MNMPRPHQPHQPLPPPQDTSKFVYVPCGH